MCGNRVSQQTLARTIEISIGHRIDPFGVIQADDLPRREHRRLHLIGHVLARQEY